LAKFLSKMAKMLKVSNNAKVEYRQSFGPGKDIAYSIRWWS
jgi:hypothetical protein